MAERDRLAQRLEEDIAPYRLHLRALDGEWIQTATLYRSMSSALDAGESQPKDYMITRGKGVYIVQKGKPRIDQTPVENEKENHMTESNKNNPSTETPSNEPSKTTTETTTTTETPSTETPKETPDVAPAENNRSIEGDQASKR